MEAVAPLVEARSGAGSSTDPVLPVQKQHLKSKQRKDKVPYTRDPSPNQKRGRQATLSRSSLKERFSLDGILTSTPIEITEIAIDVGILKNNGTEQCSCGQTAWKLEQRQHYCNWRCRKCRKTVSVCAGDTDLFSIKVALRSLIGSLWIFCAPLSLSPDKAGPCAWH